MQNVLYFLHMHIYNLQRTVRLCEITWKNTGYMNILTDECDR